MILVKIISTIQIQYYFSYDLMNLLENKNIKYVIRIKNKNKNKNKKRNNKIINEKPNKKTKDCYEKLYIIIQIYSLLID